MSPQPDDEDDPRRPPSSAAFDQIVARLRADGDLPVWPEERAAATRQHRPDPTRLDRPESDGAGPPAASTPRGQEPPHSQKSPDSPEPPHSQKSPLSAEWPHSPESDQFVPPEPPPMPPLGQAAAVGIALLGLGVLLVVAPDLLGLSEAAGLTLGLLTLAGGLGWLVLRSWTTDPPDDCDPDDGVRF